MDIKDIPGNDLPKKELEFLTKEDFILLRKRMLNNLYNGLDGECNAQLIKVAKDILIDASVDILEQENTDDIILEILKDKSPQELKEDISKFIN